MITLALDTSYTDLCVVILKDQQILSGTQKNCWKRQSEEIFPTILEMMNQASVSVDEIDEVVITKGPGSYTGVRIAMTIAKVFCSLKSIPLYTIGTLDLYAAMHEDCYVLLDARGKRAYTAQYQNGKCVMGPMVMYLEELSSLITDSSVVVGDGHLIGKEDLSPDLLKCFSVSRDQWHLEESVDTVAPIYLKDVESYRTDK